MFAYILRRLPATVPVMLIVAVLVFLMLRLTPGDPAAIIAGDNANAEQVADDPQRASGSTSRSVTQFVIWLGNTAARRFRRIVLLQEAGRRADRASGSSRRWRWRSRRSCSPSLIAVPLGVLAAYKQGTLARPLVMGFSVLGFSVPVFVIGYVLIYVFAIKLNWLPGAGLSAHRRRASAAACSG